MNTDSIEALRNLFAAPTNEFRHLAIIHQFRPRRRMAWETDASATCNDAQDSKEAIKAYLLKLANWGFGGIVANVGHEGYLENEEEWNVFLAGVRAAQELGMRVWIYDEHGYPSGAAGGIVLRDHPEYEAQGLVRMQQALEAGPVEMRPPSGWLYTVRVEAKIDSTGEIIDLTKQVDSDGWLRAELPMPCTVTRYDARCAFEGTHATRNVFRHRRYINVLQQEAVDYFYKVTDEQYLARLGEAAKAVEAVFTDEPSFMAAYFPEIPEKFWGKIQSQDKPDPMFDQLPMIPWEKSLPEKFRQRWGYDLIPELRRLFEGDDFRDLRARHDFYQLLSEIYARAFFETQQERLAKAGIQFSGHVLAEESIIHHVACEGNVMANLRAMGIPGIDMLNSVGEEILDSLRLLTCKYGSSSAHAAGCKQVMCEASDFEQQVAGRVSTLEERRGAIAVQVALGVTTITSYYPWHDVDPEVRKALLDFCARLAIIVRHGTHVANVALLYPIRTAWACYKPTAEVLSAAYMDEPLRSMDSHLYQIARTLIGQGIDFDFIDTRNLINAESVDGRLRVGDESYSILLVPPGSVMCSGDLETVEQFVLAGGRVLAFEPLSELALSKLWDVTKNPIDNLGRSPREVLTALATTFGSERVVVMPLDEQWVSQVKSALSQDVVVVLNGSHMVARRSVYQNTDFVLIANGSQQDASAEVSFADADVEIWDPWTGAMTSGECNVVTVSVPGYSAKIVVGRRNIR